MTRNRTTLTLLALLILLLVPLTLLAQSDETIAPGQTVTGQLTGESLWRQYRLEGSSGQTITIDLVSDAFDSYLKLDGPDGVTLATDDDGGGSLNARIADFALPADGVYIISAGSFNQYSVGDFTLRVSDGGSVAEPVMDATATPLPTLTSSGTPFPTFTPTPALDLALSGAEISYDRPITGTLTVDMPAAIYTFQGSAGENVTISLTSSDFDAYLELLGPDGASLATDDDSLGDLNARIESVALPESGMYTIRAGSFGGGTSGTFELSIARAQIQPVTTEAPVTAMQVTPTPTPYVFDGQINQTLSDALTWDVDTREYTFSGQAGDVVSFRMTSNEFDSYLELYGPDGTLLASDDDSGPKYGAVIETFRLPVGGEYRLLASSFNRLSAGQYELTVIGTLLTAVERPATPVALSGAQIALGTTTSGQLSEGRGSAVYTFDVDGPQPVTISVVSVDFDSLLTLLDASGTVLAVDDDSGGDLNARIENVMLPAAGRYTVTVESFGAVSGGQFSLSLERGAVVTLEPTAQPGDQTIRFGELLSGELTPGGGQVIYRFQGEAGQMVTIFAASQDFDAYLRLLDPNGAEITSDDDGGGGMNAQISLYALPVNGQYAIVVESYNETGGAFTLSLSAASRMTIEYGQTRDGQLVGSGPTVAYVFRGAAGDTVTISARSTSFDTFLSLRQAGTDAPLIEDDDGGANGTDSLIGPYTLPATGEYLIVVRGFDAGAAGPYSLQLSRVEVQPIAYGDVVTLRLAPLTPITYYRFDGRNGDVINVTVDSGGSVDTSLTLNGPDNYQLTFDDDGGPGFDPEIYQYLLTQDGSYTLMVQSIAPSAGAEARLSLTRSPLRSLDDGPQDVKVSAKQSQQVLTFSGRAGQRVQLIAEVVTAVPAAPSLTIIQNGATLATANTTGLERLVVVFTVPQDGDVLVQVGDYNYSETQFRVILERLGS